MINKILCWVFGHNEKVFDFYDKEACEKETRCMGIFVYFKRERLCKRCGKRLPGDGEKRFGVDYNE